MLINGHTQVFFVLGHPVTQVRAPEVFNPCSRPMG
jgi:shikimate dehydrogenase